MDSNYYGFLIEHGVCSNDIWIADHDFGYQICNAGYSDFFDFLPRLGSMSGTTKRKSNRKTRRKRSEQPL
jgi:predicted N-acyltransferase